MISVPRVDSLYVYDERSGGWSVWTGGVVFSDAIKYGTELSVDFIPGDTMYYIRPGDSTLYRFGSDTTDNGTTVSYTYYSTPLAIDYSLKQLDAFGLWSEATSSDSATVGIYYRADATGSGVVIGAPNPSGKYAVYGNGSHSPFNYLQILMTGSLEVNGYDLYMTNMGTPVVQ
jgi:hypothetical protein